MQPRLEDTAWWEAHTGLVHLLHPRLDFETAYWMESLRLQSSQKYPGFCLSLFIQRNRKEAKSLMPNIFDRKTPSICKLRNRPMAVTLQANKLLLLCRESMVQGKKTGVDRGYPPFGNPVSGREAFVPLETGYRPLITFVVFELN